MKLPDKYAQRLHTGNFRKVTSDAVNSIDFDEKQNIVEVEWKGRHVYHYLNATKKEWNKMIEFANEGKGLGTYLNQVFKKPYDNCERNYYQLIVESHSSRVRRNEA